MKMTGRIEAWCHSSIDTALDTFLELKKGGMDDEHADQAARILTKKAVSDALERNLAGRSASGVTTGLANGIDDNPSPILN